MKKLITTFAVAAMTTVGLVGISAPAANAACDAAYNNCESTKPKVEQVKVKKNDRVKVKIDLTKKDGKKTIVPKGVAYFTCSGPDGASKSFEQAVKGQVTKTVKFTPAGAWTCSVAFEPNNPRKYGASSTSYSFDNA